MDSSAGQFVNILSICNEIKMPEVRKKIINIGWSTLLEKLLLTSKNKETNEEIKWKIDQNGYKTNLKPT